MTSPATIRAVVDRQAIIRSAFRDEVCWLIPAGRIVTIVAGPAGLAVEWATDRPAV